MKKIITVLLTMTLLIVCLSGCGAKNVDMPGLAKELMAADIFDEDLESVSQNVTLKRLAIDSSAVEDAVSYVGTNAVVDEIIIMKATNDKGKEKIENGVKSHVSSQKKNYQSYAPDQVPKLDDYVFITSGNYEILVISNDNSKAKQIVKDYIK